MTITYPKLTFPFEGNFIPRKGRKVRPGLFMGSDVAEIREAAPGEAVPAFRIHYPASLKHIETFEILAFEDKCWWPCTALPDRQDPHRSDNSTAALLHELATCEWDLLGQMPPGCDRPPRVEEMELRHFDPGQREATLACVRRKILRNILIYQDRAYALGGEPIYVGASSHLGGYEPASSGADVPFNHYATPGSRRAV
jgi:hypothetical protein